MIIQKAGADSISAPALVYLNKADAHDHHVRPFFSFRKLALQLAYFIVQIIYVSVNVAFVKSA